MVVSVGVVAIGNGGLDPWLGLLMVRNKVRRGEFGMGGWGRLEVTAWVRRYLGLVDNAAQRVSDDGSDG